MMREMMPLKGEIRMKMKEKEWDENSQASITKQQP